MKVSEIHGELEDQEEAEGLPVRDLFEMAKRFYVLSAEMDAMLEAPGFMDWMIATGRLTPGPDYEDGAEYSGPWVTGDRQEH